MADQTKVLRKRRRAVCVLVMALLIGAVSSAAAAPKPVAPGDAKPSDFESVAGCGCHSGLVNEWSESMHALALEDPIYQAKLQEAKDATDGALGAFCNACHGPIATMTREIDSEKMSPVSSEAIGCSFCHQAVGLNGKPANTSHLVETDGVRRAQLKDPEAPHPAAYSAFHESAEFCGGCHNVDHPINGMHLEATYTEWKNGPWARDGVVCQDCHMSSQPGAIGPSRGRAAAGAPERMNISRMLFVGGQVELGPSDIATARLQSAADLVLEVPSIVAAGESVEVTVTITNKGAGHYLPTGLTEVREMWLAVYAEEESGERTQIGERRFGTILQDDKGNAPAELWEATSIKSDDRIPPRESVTDTFEFTMPAGAERAGISAALYYRSVPEELAEKAGVENPTTEMVAASQRVFASEEIAQQTPWEEREAANEGGASGALWVVLVVVVVAAAIGAFLFLWSRRAKRA